MPRFKSFEELQRKTRKQSVARRPAAPPSRELRVRVEMPSWATAAAMDGCRDLVLAWLEDRMGSALPRQALRYRDFSHGDGSRLCRGVRVRSGDRDHWVVQIEDNPGPGRKLATEVGVLSRSGHPPVVHIDVVDHSVAPSGVADEYPGNLLADLGAATPLLQDGRKLAHEPIVVESEATMDGFLDMLLDPGRALTFAVLSEPPGEDAATVEAMASDLARPLTGLAVVWVLPTSMTFRLSDRVSKNLSAFLGAWRCYRPGFSDRSRSDGHPLILWQRLKDPRGRARATQLFLRLSVDERARVPRADDPPDYAALKRESESVVRGPARFLYRLRNTLWGALPGTAVQEPAAAPAVEPEVPAVEPAAVSGEPAPASEAPSFQRRLRAAREKARVRANRYERARKRADAAERQRDDAVRRAEQLAGLVRILGGNPDAEVPFPTAWSDFAQWCDEHLEGRLALAGPARRELEGARFADIALVAQCLNWLAHEYRDGRLRGGDPELHGRIDGIEGGVFNVPCGGDSFECSWDGRAHAVEWHIKRGANTRDPRRCLRIYYFWDQRKRQVVIASMPGHRRSAMS